jgi:acetylornithine/succinyldiaminopimelate/putrescine aminotransferase
LLKFQEWKKFFSNSGAESNEGAIKIARKFGSQQGVSNPKIIVAEQSFHGRTLATLSATGNKKVQEGFAPLVEGLFEFHLVMLKQFKKLRSIIQILLLS